MADTKITGLTQTTTGTPTGDLLEVAINPATLALSRKITWHNFLLAAQPNVYVRCYNSADILTYDSTGLALPFNTERHDPYGFHSTTVNPSRFTVPSGLAGLYLIMFHVRWEAHASGTRIHQIHVNGSQYGNDQRPPLSIAFEPGHIATSIYWLNAGHYVEGWVYQSTGSDINVKAYGNYSPEVVMMRIGRSP